MIIHMKRDKTNKPYGLGLIVWSIQWGIVFAALIACVSYLIQFIIQGNLTWTPLFWIGGIIGIAVLVFLAEQAIFGNFSKKQD